MKNVISTTIDGATYKQYNANNRGTNAPDCVKRAISMAFNMDYNKVSKLLLAKAKEKHKSHWNIVPVFEPVIYELGGSKGISGRIPDPNTGKMTEENRYTVEALIDELGPNATIIMETSKTPRQYGLGNHLTCSVNGTLYDSWDSSDQYVCQYYLVENSTHQFTDIGDHIDELIAECPDLIGQLWTKYRDKYNLSGQFTNRGGRKKSEFSFYFQLTYHDDAVAEVWNLDCVFSPTMSIEQARKKMIETIKVRMYDRFYSINQKVKQRAEGMSLFYESGYTDEDRKEDRLWMDGIEQRFFNSLPGWVKPFVIYINVQQPGQYSDSYTLTTLPIKGDPRRENVNFYGYQAADVKDEIDRYRKNFARVDDDYSYAEEY